MSDTPHYDKLSLKYEKPSRIIITAEVPADLMPRYSVQALKALSTRLSLPGFRPGHVPESIARKELGEGTILAEAAERGVRAALEAIVLAEKLPLVGTPSVSVTPPKEGAPVAFKAEAYVYPKVSLPDYRALVTKTLPGLPDPTKVSVSEEELAAELERFRESYAHRTHEHTDELHEHTLPELTDEFVQALGGGFKDVADFKEKLTARMRIEKEREAVDKRRIGLIDALLEKTPIEVPEPFIEEELLRMEHEFETTIARMGGTVEGYLEHVKKSFEDMKKEWRPDAEKRAKVQLVLHALAEAEKVEPDQKRFEREVAHLMEEYRDADPERTRSYVRMRMNNERVFELLEKNFVGGEEAPVEA